MKKEKKRRRKDPIKSLKYLKREEKEKLYEELSKLKMEDCEDD
jgi:hypothetical protein